MALLLTTAQKVHLVIEPVDQYGNPARVDGVPTWALSDDTLGVLMVEPDGMSAEFITSGTLGIEQVSVSADADLGAGIRTIAATLDIQIEPSEAVGLGIIAGIPEPK